MISMSARQARLPPSASAARCALIAGLVASAWIAPPPVAAQVEVEADPFAYALNGFSLHLAGIIDSYRFSVGTFGIDVPRFFHGEDEWTVVMRGVGAKLDFLGSSPHGLFAGADVGYMRMSYTLDDIAVTENRNEVNVGVRAGYRLSIGRSPFFLSPWVGAGYSFGDDVKIGEHTFEKSRISIFPTVHVGFRF